MNIVLMAATFPLITAEAADDASVAEASGKMRLGYELWNRDCVFSHAGRRWACAASIPTWDLFTW